MSAAAHSTAMPPTISRRTFVLRSALCLGAPLAVRALLAAGSGERVTGTLLHNEAAWANFLARVRADRATAAAALDDQARPWRERAAATVVDKKHVAPSGDPHDYVSVAPYSWPDPKKADGLPWIGRDGEVNPAFYDYDNPKLEVLCHAVPALALNAFATGADGDVQHAARWLRAWFIEPATRMNPNLQHAQMVPGRHQGSAGGIIDTTSFVFLVDAITRLPVGPQWTDADLRAVKAWFGEYLAWLLQSKNGRQEGAAKNNHGTWYDAQVCAFAVFSGNDAIARKQIESVTPARIAAQIEPDGRQPAELRRTLALTYTTYNLLAFACVAQIARRFDIDLWRQTCGGRRLIDAVNWVLPFYAREREWTHPQIHPFEFSNAALVLNLAWQGTGDARFATVRDRVAKRPWDALTFSKASLAVRRAAG